MDRIVILISRVAMQLKLGTVGSREISISQNFFIISLMDKLSVWNFRVRNYIRGDQLRVDTGFLTENGNPTDSCKNVPHKICYEQFTLNILNLLKSSQEGITQNL